MIEKQYSAVSLRSLKNTFPTCFSDVAFDCVKQGEEELRIIAETKCCNRGYLSIDMKK